VTTHELSFPILRDDDGKAIAAWGLANEKRPPLPHPTTAIVDSEGVVRWLHVDPSVPKRPSSREVLEKLDEIDGK
jgi:peroxiredoxin